MKTKTTTTTNNTKKELDDLLEGRPNGEFQDDKKAEMELNHRLGKYITLCIDAKAAFEMYAYRIIAPEVFAERMKEIVEFTYKSK